MSYRLMSARTATSWNWFHMDLRTQLKFEIIAPAATLSLTPLNNQKAFAILDDRMGDAFTSSFTQVTEQFQDMSHCAKLKKWLAVLYLRLPWDSHVLVVIFFQEIVWLLLVCTD